MPQVRSRLVVPRDAAIARAEKAEQEAADLAGMMARGGENVQRFEAALDAAKGGG